MTDPLDTDEALVVKILRRADTESTVPADARERARATTFDAYDDMAATHGGRPKRHPFEELIGFDAVRGDNSVSAKPRRMFLAAVAAVLLIVVGSAVFASSSTDQDRLIDSADGISTEDVNPDGSLVQPARLAVGPHRTEVFGPSVGFTLEQPLWLVREGDGVVELAVDPDDPTEARVWLVGPESFKLADGHSTIQQFMAAHPEGGPQALPSEIAGQLGLSWVLRAPTGSSCAIDELCIPLIAEPIEVGLVGSRSTHVFDVPFDDSDPDGPSLVIVVWTTADWTSSVRGEDVRDLLDSLQIEADS